MTPASSRVCTSSAEGALSRRSTAVRTPSAVSEERIIASSPRCCPPPRTNVYRTPSSRSPRTTSVEPSRSARYAGTISAAVSVSGSPDPRTSQWTPAATGKTSATTTTPAASLRGRKSSSSEASSAAPSMAPRKTPEGSARVGATSWAPPGVPYTTRCPRTAAARPMRPTAQAQRTSSRVRAGRSASTPITTIETPIHPGAEPGPDQPPSTADGSDVSAETATPASHHSRVGCRARWTSQGPRSTPATPSAPPTWTARARTSSCPRRATSTTTSATTVMASTSGANAAPTAIQIPSRSAVCQCGTVTSCSATLTMTGATTRPTTVPSRPWSIAPPAATTRAYEIANRMRAGRWLLTSRARRCAVRPASTGASRRSTQTRSSGVNHTGTAASPSSST